MKIGSMKEALLSSAKDTFLFDCRVVGLDDQTIDAYSHALVSFIRFTGNILVKDLTAEHVRVYIDNLSDGPCEGEEHMRAVISHYALIHEWVRWLYAQKFLTKRSSDDVEPPRFLTRRFSFVRDSGKIASPVPEERRNLRLLAMTIFLIVVKFRPHAGVAKW